MIGEITVLGGNATEALVLVQQVARAPALFIDETREYSVGFVNATSELSHLALKRRVVPTERILETDEVGNSDGADGGRKSGGGSGEIDQLNTVLLGTVLAAIVGSIAIGIFAEVVAGQKLFGAEIKCGRKQVRIMVAEIA